ncbi:hypothetical protein [Labrenzia sp. VG12]|uniref:hypothetical protein n=1 Tax=Labrenzia sp. VG12 TaxID=2021862 RepID=UPI000B8C280A|nr:hypothetical protein [Labrenzia sp. VG12]ASP32776.1 hypothetical protein CHH27_05550 [Labrenzia sp. VG12]
MTQVSITAHQVDFSLRYECYFAIDLDIADVSEKYGLALSCEDADGPTEKIVGCQGLMKPQNVALLFFQFAHSCGNREPGVGLSIPLGVENLESVIRNLCEKLRDDFGLSSGAFSFSQDINQNYLVEPPF